MVSKAARSVKRRARFDGTWAKGGSDVGDGSRRRTCRWHGVVDGVDLAEVPKRPMKRPMKLPVGQPKHLLPPVEAVLPPVGAVKCMRAPAPWASEA